MCSIYSYRRPATALMITLLERRVRSCHCHSDSLERSQFEETWKQEATLASRSLSLHNISFIPILGKSSKSGTKSSTFIGKECQYDVVFSESGTSGFAYRYARSALKDSTLSSVIT